MSETNTEQPRRRRNRAQILSVAQRRIQRTYKLDEDTKEKFLNAVSKGMSETRACKLARINSNTYYAKKKEVVAYLESGTEPNDDPRSNIDEWAMFIEDVEEAVAQHELNLIDDALDVDSAQGKKMFWARNVTILERRNREDWGKNEQITHNVGHFDKDEKFL